MVITEWPSESVAKDAAEKIANVREQASEEIDNVMISSHAVETFALGKKNLILLNY